MRRTRLDADPCPIARVPDQFGDWWSPIILRDAIIGVQRFEDFQKNLDIVDDEGLMEKVAYRPASRCGGPLMPHRRRYHDVDERFLDQPGLD